MTPSEIIKSLRHIAEISTSKNVVCKEAADLIESLLSERAEKDNQISALTAELTDKNGQLKSHVEQLLDDVKQIDSLTSRAESAEAELKEATIPESIETAAENMFQALSMAPQYTRELMDSVSAFWKLWAEWRGARKGTK